MLDFSGNPEQVGLSEQGMLEAYGILETAVAQGELMGAGIQVARGGISLPPKCFGRRELKEGGAPVDSDTIFLVASITKPIVAAAVMKLVQQGKLSLEDRVVYLIPEFGKKGKEEVRIRHLLTHTSGLPDMLPDNMELRARKAPLSEFIERIYEVDLLFEPGTQISYQSCGTAMVGEIVERLEGVPLRDFLKTTFFDPIELEDTSLGVQEDRRDRVSDVKLPGGDFEYGGQDSDWNWNSEYWHSLGAPWGGMFTTTMELTELLQVFLYGGKWGENRLLGPATVAAMTSDQTSLMPDISEPDKLAQCWGLGWQLRSRSLYGDLTSASTFGHGGATGTVAWVDPVSQVSCVLFSNDPTGARKFRPRVSNAVAGSVLLM